MEEVEATNNLAERQLWPAVIARKVSCGNKTPKGAHSWEILTSLAATCNALNPSPSSSAKLHYSHTLAKHIRSNSMRVFYSLFCVRLVRLIIWLRAVSIGDALAMVGFRSCANSQNQVFFRRIAAALRCVRWDFAIAAETNLEESGIWRDVRSS
ncbi:transposase [Pedosphaera parvula]|uniref:transposase n=1 Tax=Pedosphaera parvula TaxID=1032527 RepID=UPI00135F1167